DGGEERGDKGSGGLGDDGKGEGETRIHGGEAAWAQYGGEPGEDDIGERRLQAHEKGYLPGGGVGPKTTEHLRWHLAISRGTVHDPGQPEKCGESGGQGPEGE